MMSKKSVKDKVVMGDVDLREMVLEDYAELATMDIPEYTLLKKWKGMNEKYGDADQSMRDLIQSVKSNIWIPESPDDYLKLEVGLHIVKDGKDEYHQPFEILRDFTSSAMWRKPIGRCIRSIAYDKVTGKYLGILVLASDLIQVTPREKYIGWTVEQKMKPHKQLGNTAVGSCIVPLQPLGFNYVGGKLMSLIISCRELEDFWNDRYGCTLAGITTTSLYGSFSQYSGLKHWKKCGTTEGKITKDPSDNTYNEIHKWLKQEYPEKTQSFKSGIDPKTGNHVIKTNPRLRILEYGLRQLGFKNKDKPMSNAPRGVYFCELFENTRDFLCCKDKTLGERKFDNSIESLTDLWKTKYAGKRIKSLIKNDRTSIDDTLFYDDIIGITWEECQEKYSKQVGR